MSNSVTFALGVELVMIVLTVLILLAAGGIFSKWGTKRQKGKIWSGLVLLFFTFAWSVITGIVLSLNGIHVRL